jgi:hypothetical protein
MRIFRFNSFSPEDLITESKRNIVRQLVRDIIYTFKNKGEGEYDLPTETTGDDYYQFDNLETNFNLELKIHQTDKVETFELEGGYYEDDEVMEIEILYNPNAFPNQLWNLVGELNEVVRHELQHIIQYERGDENEPDETSSEIYYTQEHELEAQVAGFKRIAKLRKEPFEKVVREWFTRNFKKHGMNSETQKRVIQKILDYYKRNK